MADPSPRGRIGTLARGACAGALIGAPAVLSLDPVGVYHPEEKGAAIIVGALCGALAGAAAWTRLGRRGRRRDGVIAVALLGLLVALTHSNLIALSFSLAVDPRVVWAALGLAALVLGGAWSRGVAPGRAAWLALLPVVWLPTLHQAVFMRRPVQDCAALADPPGVHRYGRWPEHDDPALRHALLYDVIADEDLGLVFSAYVHQTGEIGAGLLSVRDARGGQVVHEASFHDGRDRWFPNRMALDPGRRRLWVPSSSYEPGRPVQLERFRYGPGPTLELERRVESPLDPSDMVRVDGALWMLDYPRRFDDEPASRLGRVDPETLAATDVGVVSADGWMTEYLVPDPTRGALWVTDVLGHLFEMDLAHLEPRRAAWIGVSTLSGVEHDGVLYLAAPYRRGVVVVDPERLIVLATLPGGDAMREVEVDRRRGRLYATAYGDGDLWAYDLAAGGAPLGRIALGTPLRGLHVLEESGDVLAGGGCGLARVDPVLAFHLEGRAPTTRIDGRDVAAPLHPEEERP